MASRNPTGEALAESLRRTLTPVVQGLGLVLEEVIVTPAGSRRVLRVVLDFADADADAGADGGAASAGSESLTLDAVAKASREISATLDASDVMGATPYVLEVSSPGVDRPLTTPRHFARNLRRLVSVTLSDGSTVQGRVTAVGDDLQLEVEGAKKGTKRARAVSWDDVTRAQVQVEFKRLDDEAGDDEEDGAEAGDDESGA
ncbi:ribosome maturation factor RimP [Angustibacter sp. McL0619]|uniref:ribosome maturation factor RimP n=1 Tax=Angustibacter sp. McL0619 TaxID=3415676 RepID=UPI003CE98EFF